MASRVVKLRDDPECVNFSIRHDPNHNVISLEMRPTPHSERGGTGTKTAGPLYLGGLRECDDDSCIISESSSIYEQDANTTEEHLKPYNHRVCKPKENYLSLFFLLIAGSFVRVSVVFTLCVLVSLLLVFGAIPQNIFPFDTFGVAHLLALVTLGAGAYLSIDIGKYKDIMEGYTVGMGSSSVLLAHQLCSALYDTDMIMKPIQRFSYEGTPPDTKVSTKTAKILSVLTDLWFITKAIMYAGSAVFSEQTVTDLPLKGSVCYHDIIPSLPMPSVLLEELRHTQRLRSDLINPLIYMYNQRLMILSQQQCLPEITATSLMSLSSSISSSYSSVIFLLSGGSRTPRFISNFFSGLLWVYCVLLAFPLYQYFALQYSLWIYYVAMLTLVSTLVIGFDVLLNVFANPFSMFSLINKTNLSPFEPETAADNVARTIDGCFELMLKQQIQLSLQAVRSKTQ